MQAGSMIMIIKVGGDIFRRVCRKFSRTPLLRCEFYANLGLDIVMQSDTIN